MFTRTITIEAQPSVQIILYYDSRSNAEKTPTTIVNNLNSIVDDYGQSALFNPTKVLSDVLCDLSESNRARGEIEIVNMRSQLKFDERIEKDAPIKAFVTKKRHEQMMRQAPRVAMPNGLPQQ